MAQGPNYNIVYPALGSGNTVGTTTFTGNGLFPAGNTSAPGVAVGTTNVGLFYDSVATSLGVAANGYEVGLFSQLNVLSGGTNFGALRLGTGGAYLTCQSGVVGRLAVVAPGNAAYGSLVVTSLIAGDNASNIVSDSAGVTGLSLVSGNANIFAASGKTFTFQQGSNFPIRIDGNGFFMAMPFTASYATTTVAVTNTQSLGTFSNIAAGVTTTFYSLPTAAPGLQFSIMQAQSGTATVVVNPQATDTLNVAGLTKAAGASVAANAKFSVITFICPTLTQWVAQSFVGTWS